MISFVWPDFMPFVPWAGGSETYTMGQLKELMRRGIPTRMIACNTMVAESIKQFTDIPLLTLKGESELAHLDDTLIFVFLPVRVTTKKPSYLVLHTTIKGPLHDDTPYFANNGLGSMRPITTSKYMASYWQHELQLPKPPAVVYPFADEAFNTVERKAHKGKPRVLFAGRPTQEKGVFTLLASLHMPPLHDKDFELTCVMNINHKGGAEVINALFQAHPRIKAIPAQQSREGMAQMFAAHDVVVMPSSSILWKEAFGMISIEAQHAGCRVVASDDGGLPETDCGGLILVKPDDPLQLAEGIKKAIELGPLTNMERQRATSKFTAKQSVDELLQVINEGN